MTTEERLAEAKDALHELMTGSKVRVVVDQNGERVEYTLPTRAGLLGYIAALEAEIATAGQAPTRGAMRFWF